MCSRDLPHPQIWLSLPFSSSRIAQMAVALKLTSPRFGHSLATVVTTTEMPGYTHLGPGVYDMEDPNRPTLAKSIADGYFPSMAPNTPRIPQPPAGYRSELDARPDMGPGRYYDDKEVDSFATDLNTTCRRDHSKSVFMHSPRTARIAEYRSKDQIINAEVPVRFDHERESKLAWSHGGKLGQSSRGLQSVGRFDGHGRPLTSRQQKEMQTTKLKVSRANDQKLRDRVANIHKYGVPGNSQDALEDTSMSQAGLYRTILLNNHKLKTAHGSVFNSGTEKFSKCPTQLLTELQFSKTAHIGPGHYHNAHERSSIRLRTAGSKPSSAFASSSPRFRKRSRRELTNTRSQAHLVKEIEQKKKAQDHRDWLYNTN